MGEVWLADDPDRGRPAALKFINTRLGDARSRAALLAHEADCLARVDHRAVPRPLGCFEEQGEPFLALEAVLNEGAAATRSLTDLRGAPPRDWIAPVLEVCEALACAHAAGVVHRDIKPANVLIDSAGRASIIDFGVAAVIRNAPAERALTTGGSPLSMSPQQRAGEAPAPSDDVYAVGALMHELAFARAPSADVERAAAPANAGVDGDGAGPSLPAGLAGLIARCLQSEPGQRPADMQAVHDALAGIAGAELNATQAPAGFIAPRAAERIRPQSPHNAALASIAASEPQRGKVFPWRTLAAVSAAWMLLLALVLSARLPERTATVERIAAAASAPSTERSAGAATDPSTGQPIVAPFEYARLSRERAAMLDDVNRVLDIQQRLAERAVERWGGERWEAAAALAEQGDERFRDNDFPGAGALYGEAEAALLALEAQAASVAQAAVQAGLDRLEQGRDEEAIEQFELALAIDPTLVQASEGIERANSLDEVTALLAEAAAAERDGDLQRAVERYEAVLAIDDAQVVARDALLSLRAQLAQGRFDRLMSDGFAALASGDYSSARNAFGAAGKLRPGADAVRDALAQVDVEQRGNQIARLRRDAEAHARAERWSQALAAYQQVLAIDASLTFAQRGARQAEEMATLYERLEFYSSDVLRLTDGSIRQRAVGVLQQADAVANPGAELTERRNRLAAAVDSVTTPVVLSIESDNQTQVRILRAADLGRFERREVTLRPGRYTLVGTRDGYRDVREEITLLAGAAAPVVVVRCSEKI
jgi:tetratricopeptide (TPR) repeat protein